MQKYFIIVIVLYALCPAIIAAENVSLREAINKAARQQTLTQQIAKLYLVNSILDDERSIKNEQEATVLLFQEQLRDLESYTPTDNIKANIKIVKVYWHDYQNITHWKRNKKQSKQLFKLSDEMLFASQLLLQSYEKYARKLNDTYYNNNMLEFVQMISLVGKQRMLTQRIMLLYLASTQDIDPININKKLYHSIEEFEFIMSYLQKNKYNSSKIDVQLRSMKHYWNQLSTLLEAFQYPTKEKLKLMLTLTNNLSEIADHVSMMYEDLGIKLSLSKSINVASYQNMLTQKIAKSYVAITYNYSNSKHKRELLTCIDLFEDKMKSMIRSARTEEILNSVNVVQTMWKNYKTLTTNWENMNELSVSKVLESSHIIMATCDQVAKAIEEYAQTIPEYESFFKEKDGNLIDSKNNIAHLIRLAGLQRIFSQRIIVYFVMNALNIDIQLSQTRLNECLVAYETNTAMMRQSDINTPKINKSLDKIDQSWGKIKESCLQPTQKGVNNMLEQGATLFQQLDALNMLYEDLMDQLLTEEKY